MKKYLLFASICFGLNGLIAAQSYPALRVDYIPVQRAAPLDFSDIQARFAIESQANESMLQQEAQGLFAQQVANVDMLPLRKKIFQDGMGEVSKELMERAAASALMNGSGNVSFYRQKFVTLFNATLIQSYKEEYRRVKEWEIYLRDKNALDAPYKNGIQPTGLTNREVISILYGTDQMRFDKVNWK